MRTIGLATLLIAATLTACGDDSSGTPDDLQIDAAWVRSTPEVADNAAVYLTITSPADDRLTSVVVDDGVAGEASMHETVTEPASSATGHHHGGESGNGDHGDHGTAGGMSDISTMQQVDSIELPAGEPVVFAPGELHIMLEELVDPLESGEAVDLTLEFETAEALDVTVDVLDQAPDG